MIVHDNGCIRIKQSYGKLIISLLGLKCHFNFVFLFFVCLFLNLKKDKTKIGIEEEKPIGFVFADVTASIDSIREEIDGLLKELAGHNYNKLPDYLFVDRNGWPVLRTQEANLSTLDLLASMSIKIRFPSGPSVERPRTLNIPSINFGNVRNGSIEGPVAPNSPGYLNNNSLTHTPSFPTLNQKNENMSLPEPGRNQAAWSFTDSGIAYDPVLKRGDSKKMGLFRRPSKTSKKPAKTHLIMLSYARAEAAEHALNLKLELANLNISTYLDVHEITTGIDWQDSLNNAVSNCVLFVPLITPMYGNTQWTNREVSNLDAS